MKVFRAVCALLTCAALCVSNASYAQPHPGVLDSSGAEFNSSRQDEPTFKEMAGSNPCPRWRMESPEDRRQFVYDERVAWMYVAWIRICMESVRSDAVALAWAQGMDEHGVPLEADARAGRLAEMEGWLRSLQGKFRVEGHRWNYGASSQVVGTADCFGIGSGPGVSCLISADWMPDEDAGKGRNPAAPEVAIRPQVLLFGLDPDAMQIRVTHVDAIAVELHGFLQDGAVILNEQSPPEVLDSDPPDEREMQEWTRDMLTAAYRGTPFRTPFPKSIYFRNSLSRVAMDEDGNFLRRLSRIAMAPGGDVDMQFYVFTPASFSSYLNPPIEFDLQLHREPQPDAEVQVPAVAPDITCASPARSGERQKPDEAEYAPAGVMKESGTQEMLAWLGRLVGQYNVEGYVDLCGEGNPRDQRPVTGNVDCVAAGSPPSVHCKVNVGWPQATSGNGAPMPGGVSNLAPAQFLFSLFTRERYTYLGMIPGEPTGGDDTRGLHFLQLDNRGIAEWASSELVGDTFMSRENCVDIPGKCYRTTRIIATPDSDEISMRVDVEMDGKRILRQSFVLRRACSPPHASGCE